MPNIIKNKTVIADDWSVLRLQDTDTPDTVTVPEGKVIVPLAVWQAQRAVLAQRPHPAIWLASSDLAEDIAEPLTHFEIIAIDFPEFTDGRGYSTAYNLRARLHYAGEIRAIGDVLRDQLFYMQRVGFDAYAVRADKDTHDALKGLTDFSETYQTSWDEKNPLFRRAKRDAANSQ